MTKLRRLAGLMSLGCFSALASLGAEKDVVVNKDFEVRSYDDVVLKGTLSLPAQIRKIVVTLHGSFVQTRDGDLDASQKWMFPEGAPERKLFRDVAKHLATFDVATFRFDKRASGASEGDYAETDLDTLAKDASAILKKLRTEYPNVPVGFLAQSEGVLVALREFAIGEKPDFLILQGPPLQPLLEILPFWRDKAAAPFLNDQDGAMAKKFPYLTAFYQALYHGDMAEKIAGSDEKYYTLRAGDWSYRTNLQKYRQYNWNGLEMLAAVDCPVAVIIGELDKNVPFSPIEKLIAAKKEGSFPHVHVEVLAGLEHSFREVTPGESFVEAMRKPISKKYLDLLSELSILRDPQGCGEGLGRAKPSK
jgi:alpha-beta hydrolase superfamily lysophospholipase